MDTDVSWADPSSHASSSNCSAVMEQRIPLLTPSASPPIQHFHGRPDAPAPTKKRRMSQTPSLLSSVRGNSDSSTSARSTTASSSRQSVPPDPDEELHSLRRANAFKVLDVWASLAEKYEKRLDEDDIVDLENETLVKDCGVLRSTTNMYGIGCFAEQQERQRQDDETGLDDELDEIDAFADNGDCTSQAETDGEDDLEILHSKRLPPVQELNPDDAADLAEFLEAERTRRERFGNMDEDEDEVDLVPRDETDDFSEERQSGNSSGSEDDDAYDEDLAEDSAHEAITDYRSASTPSGSPELDAFDGHAHTHEEANESVEPLAAGYGDADAAVHSEESETHWDIEDPVTSDADSDELNAWDQDESNAVLTVDDETIVSSDEVDEPESIPKGRNLSLPRDQRKPRQAAEAERRGRPQKQKAVGKVELKKPSTVVERAVASSSVLQLQTPPRSSSFSSSCEPGESYRLVSSLSTKRQDAKPKEISRSISPNASASDEVHEVKARRPSKKQYSKKKKTKSPTNSREFRLVPEVVIAVPSRSLSRTAGPSSRSRDDDTEDNEASSDTQTEPSKDKGKSRAAGRPLDVALVKSRARPPRKASPAPPRSPAPLAHKPKSKVVPNFKKRRRDSSPFSALDTVVFDMGRTAQPPVNQRPVSRRKPPSPSNDHSHSDVEEEIDDRLPRQSKRPSNSSRLHSERNDPSFDSDHHPSVDPSYNRASSQPYLPSRPVQRDGGENHDTSHRPPSLRSQSVAPGPSLQDPAMQYHLAQALQSLSIIMSGTMPFGPAHAQTPYSDARAPPSTAPHHNMNIPLQWPPYTPHHQRFANFGTPQSAASAPPTSPPVGSDYSNSASSSPIKQPADYDRGRPRRSSQARSSSRLRSAIRGSRSRSRSQTRLRRRVSFSSPEAVHIEETVCEVFREDSHQTSEEEEEEENSNDEERHYEREPYQRSEMRAHTPGPSSVAPGRSQRRVPYEDDRPRASSDRNDRTRSRTPALRAVNRVR